MLTYLAVKNARRQKWYCNYQWNYYLSTTSSEQSAEIDILKDMLLFRDDPNLCIGLFVNAEISTAINCICTE